MMILLQVHLLDNVQEVKVNKLLCDYLCIVLLLAGNKDSMSNTVSRQCTRAKGKQTIV